MLALYRAATRGVEIAASPLLAALAARPGTWGLRTGRLPRRDPGGIWLHAASVGELLGAAPLIEEIRRLAGGAGVVVSTTSASGFALAGGLGGGAVGRTLLPLDFPGCVARAFDAIRPALLVVCETELWPNLYAEAHARGVPVVLVNARLSRRRFGRYRALRSLFAPALAEVAWIAAQTEEDRARFLFLGARPERVEVAGSTKGDAPAAVPSRAGARAALGLGERELLVALGSVRSAEDEAVLGAAERLLARWPQLRILYAPRHPGRSQALVGRLARAVPALSLTAWRERPAPWRALVVDTLGELAALYAAADAAFVGGSLSAHGGHNPLEPARAGVPIVMGPHRHNVEETFARLQAAGGAVSARDGDELEARLSELLGDEAERRRRGAALAAAAARESSAAERVARGLAARGLLPAAPAAAARPANAR